MSSAESYTNFIKSQKLGFNNTLRMEHLLKSVFEDGWIARNKPESHDIDDKKMQADWDKSYSKKIVDGIYE